MSKQNGKRLLQGLGFSKREEAVYLAIMRGGKVSQSDIAGITGINRTSLYPILKELSRRDSIVKVPEGKRLFYIAEKPEKLLRKAHQTTGALEEAMPGLMDIFLTSGHKPKISVYDGQEGLYKVVKEAFEQANGYVKSFSSPNNFMSVLNRKDADELIALIERREVVSYSLSSRTEENKKLLSVFSQKNLRWKLMPKEVVFSTEFLLYNRTTVITSWGRQFSIVIESEDVTKFLEAIFDHFWKTVPK